VSIDTRLAALADMERREFVFVGFANDLVDRCRGAIMHLTGDPERDVVALEEEAIGDYFDIRGRAPGGHVRLLFSLRECEALAVEATVLAAKGSIEVDAEALGRSGALYGNRIHVVRGFDLLLETAIEHGAAQIVGHPVDERVRALYVLMGFVGGEVLDLSDKQSLERVVVWIDTQYEECKHRFPDFRRPW
jgi:hypothetical protein